MPSNITSQQFAQQRVEEKLFPKKLQKAVEIAEERDKSFGYKVRKKLDPGEIKFFASNPKTPGYADFKTTSIVLNPFSSLDANRLSFLVDNEAIR